MQENLIVARANAASSNSIPPDPLADAEGLATPAVGP